MAEKVDRAVRIEKVVEILDKAEGTLTTYQVCQKMGLSYSAFSRQIVVEAWQRELISGCQGDLRNGMKVYYWWSKKNQNIPQQIALEI